MDTQTAPMAQEIGRAGPWVFFAEANAPDGFAIHEDTGRTRRLSVRETETLRKWKGGDA